MFPSNFTDQQKKDIQYFITSIISLGTVVSLWQTLKYQFRVYHIKKNINLVSNQSTKEIEEIQKEHTSKKVIVTGKVAAGKEKPIIVRTNRILGDQYINHIQYREKIYSNDNYDLGKGNYHINLKQLLRSCEIKTNQSFNIVSSKEKAIKVMNYDRADYTGALEIIKWQQKKKDLTIFENFQGLFLSLIRAIVTIAIPDRNVTFMRGIETGERNIEVGIKIGTPLAILGIISVDSQGFLMIEPISIFKNKLSYLLELKEDLANQIEKRNGWLLISLIGGIYVGRRIYKNIKSIKLNFNIL